MASPTLVIDPSDVARRVLVESTTYGLYGVAANGLTIIVCVCCIMYCMSYVKPWWNCGWRWANKTQFNILTYLFFYELKSIFINSKHNTLLLYQVFSNTAHFSLHPRLSILFPLNSLVTNIKEHQFIEQSISQPTASEKTGN
jgi:hypothetical protein